MDSTFVVTVYPHGSSEEIRFKDIDRISLVNNDTYGPIPVYTLPGGGDTEYSGVVLFVNPENIDCMEVSR